eukprot:SAG31_NODE_42945_length_269_cov_0.864706_2_plen_67_part_01
MLMVRSAASRNEHNHASRRSIFGIGVYTDTPGSPVLEAQLDAAAELVGRGGWVTIFLCAWRTHATSC